MRTRFISTATVLASALTLSCGHPSKPAETTGTGGPSGGDTPAGEVGGTAPAPAQVSTKPISLAEAGLELASLDRTADPCVDFYQFACGGWLASHEIPADKTRYARFTEITDRNEDVLHEILETYRQPPGDNVRITRVRGALGNFYGACMDEEAIEKAGTTAIDALLKEAAKVKDARSVATAILHLQQAGIPVIFKPSVDADFKDATSYALFLDTEGLGLPDRDYYFKKDFAPKVAAYTAHVERMFALIGKKKADAKRAAADVLKLETALAQMTKTRVERRDVAKNYNPFDRAALKAAVPGFDWDAYFTSYGNPDIDVVMLTTPPFFQGFDKLLSSTKPAVWASYLQWHILHATASSLPKRFDEENFALEKALRGAEEQEVRWKRCIDATTEGLGEYLGQPYVEKMFPGESKSAAVALIAQIQRALDEGISALDWMGDTTKQAAHAKLAKLTAMIGFPDKWRDYDFETSRDTHTANVLAGRLAELKRDVGRGRKPVDRGDWLMPPQIVNAYYNPNMNNTALPAGILQPPFFGKDRSVAANLGGIGMVIGHELTHGFDDTGAQFDGDGNLRNWWGADDQAKFLERGTCLADQYSTFEELPGQFVNGKLTLGENIADLGGVKMALHAYRTMRKDATERYTAEGFNEDQIFFLAVGQAWCSKTREDETKLRLTTDPHSPPRFRVMGALSNLPEFGEAFSCKVGQPMRPAKTCQVW